MTEQLTHRQIDAWAAENLMGWDCVSTEGGTIWQQDKETLRIDWSPTTDANADAEVLRQVKDRFIGDDLRKFKHFCQRMWKSRCCVGPVHVGELWFEEYIPGDYVIAAYAVAHNLDPVELWKSLQGETK